MDSVLKTLASDQFVLDLGCGRGSFHYTAYKCQIVGIDLNVDRNVLAYTGERISYVNAQSHALPLDRCSVDFAVCNHSLEHIVKLDETLCEIGRVLKPDGLLWISVPNGFSVSDGLYRWLYSGGGHVNRFTFESLKGKVESVTGLELLQWNTLTSSFVYCQRPPDTVWRYLPRRLKVLHALGVMRPFTLLFDGLSRLSDRSLHTNFSQYGWGFLFGRTGTFNFPLPSYYNVCAGCGCGNPVEILRPVEYRSWGVRFYRCPGCGQANLLFEPPSGFQ